MRAGTIRFPSPSYRHLSRMCDGTAMFEHAWFHVPRWEHGYCTDDVARALLTASRASGVVAEAELEGVASMALGYLRAACVDGCPVRTRLDHRRAWVDEGPSPDTDGRVLWALGTAISSSSLAWVREAASGLFAALASTFEAPFPRSVAFAALGAGEVLLAAKTRDEASCAAASLLQRIAPKLARPRRGADALCVPIDFADPVHWPWPEDRLTYANAAIPEALIVTGVSLNDRSMIDDGLTLLQWLVNLEHGADGFSFTPVGGRGPGDVGPAFDQQPIEAAAMVDACWRAWRATADDRWADEALVAASWFLGANDIGVALYDEDSGGGADGLRPDGLNNNRGAESTLAALTALQRADDIAAARGCEQELPRYRRTDPSSTEHDERIEQRALVDERSAHTAVGGAIGQVDLPVISSMNALNEDHVVDITDSFPFEFGLEDRLRQNGADHPRGRIEQRDVRRVVAVGSTLVKEQQQSGLTFEGRSAGPDTEAARSRADDGVVFELIEVALPVHLVGAPKVFEIVEHRDLHVGMNAVHQRDPTVGQVEDHRVFVGDALRTEDARTGFVDDQSVSVFDEPMSADLPRAASSGMVQTRVGHHEMLCARTIGTSAPDALDTRILDGVELVTIAGEKHSVESVVEPVHGAEQQHVAHVVEEASTCSWIAPVPVANAAGEHLVAAAVMEEACVEERAVAGRVAGLEQRAAAHATGPRTTGAGAGDRRHGHAFSSERERSGWIPISDAKRRMFVAEQFAHAGHVFADSPIERRMR